MTALAVLYSPKNSLIEVMKCSEEMEDDKEAIWELFIVMFFSGVPSE